MPATSKLSDQIEARTGEPARRLQTKIRHTKHVRINAEETPGQGVSKQVPDLL